jgi:predicted nuclease of predicted toxin-antitoxin system
MRFLADESCDGAVVRAMREAGHDVTSVRDTMRGASDRSVLDAALSERRLLLTEDKDFGELVFARGDPLSEYCCCVTRSLRVR